LQICLNIEKAIRTHSHRVPPSGNAGEISRSGNL
jgi:hypothetical protein